MVKTGDLRLKAAALFVFVVSAFLQLLPLSLHPARALNDTQDCLLNTWILDQGRQNLLKDPLRFFEANAFHPHRNVLAFSEHMLPLVLLSLPVQLVFGNPVLSYNFVFLFCVVLNAYAMFLLVRHVAKSDAAGIVAGLVYGFSAPLMQQLSHLQLLAAWGVPLGFLYLLKYLERGRLGHSVLFALFFALQGLSCLYYGLFFVSVLVVALPLLLLAYRQRLGWPFVAKLGLPLLAAGLVLAVFSVPYLWLFRHFQFRRMLSAGAGLLNYFAVPRHNVLLGGLLERLGGNEYYLFPGLAALGLSLFWIAGQRVFRTALPKAARYVLWSLVALNAGVLAFVLVSGGSGLKLGPLSLSAHNPAKPAFYILLTLSLAGALSLILLLARSRGVDDVQDRIGLHFLFVLIWSLFLSFGSAFTFQGASPFNMRFRAAWFSPFRWFYDLIPGFQGIRMPSRYSVFVVMSLAVLAGLGLKSLMKKMRSRPARTGLAAGLVVLLTLEYLSTPHESRLVPVGKDIPPTYQWLAELPKDAVLMELPLFSKIPHEARFMYLSLFHGHRIVNGYSGFIPASSDYLDSIFREFPSWAGVDVLQKLGVRYVVFHSKAWREERAQLALRRMKTKYRDYLRPVRVFHYGFSRPNDLQPFLGEDHVFGVAPPVEAHPPVRHESELQPERWTVEASRSNDLALAMKDGRMDTAWRTDQPKRSGDSLVITLAGPMRILRIDLRLGELATDSAVNLRVLTSEDGRHWKAGFPGYSPGEFVMQLVQAPLDPVQTIRLSGRTARFIKLVHVGSHKVYPWSIPEMRIFVERESEASSKYEGPGPWP